ncbi:MAG: sulfotransferase [Ilumatobacteraceae bacterium]
MNSPGLLQITGHPRSGTTMLEILLAQRFGGVALGEARFWFERGILDDQLCACGQPFWSCSFWSGVVADVYGSRRRAETAARLVLDGNWLAMWSFPRARFQPSAGGHYSYLRSMMSDLLGAVAERAGNRWIIDSSKDPVWFELQAGIVERTVMLHIVRDPRAVAHSNQKAVARPEIAGEKVLMPQFGLMRTMRDYTIWNVTSALTSRSSGHVLIQYEELCQDVDAVLAPIAPLVERSGAETDVFPEYHSVSGNPLRFKLKSPADLVVTPAKDEWRTDLDGGTRRIAQALSAPTRAFVTTYSALRRDRLTAPTRPSSSTAEGRAAVGNRSSDAA